MLGVSKIMPTLAVSECACPAMRDRHIPEDPSTSGIFFVHTCCITYIPICHQSSNIVPLRHESMIHVSRKAVD